MAEPKLLIAFDIQDKVGHGERGMEWDVWCPFCWGRGMERVSLEPLDTLPEPTNTGTTGLCLTDWGGSEPG